GAQTVVTEFEIVIDNDVILDGEGNLTVDGDQHHRMFWVRNGVVAELRGVSVRRGRALGEVTEDREGGGIFNEGTLTLTHSTVSGNGTEYQGGGIFNEGTLTLTHSTVSENSAIVDWADAEGGGIYKLTGTLALTDSTVSGNRATSEGGGIYNFLGTLTLRSSLIDGECAGTIASAGHNIESPGDTCSFDQPTDQVNVSADDLNLGPLQDNGGPTQTRALGADSVAIDQIPAEDCVDADGAPLTTDQRGQPRPETGGTMCDVGAFEVQP
ncbi:MAG TPA: choice-of-anchor Q domain-containing protein, partial [Polyangiales bacterium]|nr:choice-of-anchor Q domain-containing protein [Polyangiales bacterium]